MGTDAKQGTGVTSKAANGSISVFQKRIRKFKSLKRGYYSFLILVAAYVLSFFLPFLMNSKALVVKYRGEYRFPIFRFYEGAAFGQSANFGEANYRLLAARLSARQEEGWVLMPPVPYNPTESADDIEEDRIRAAYAKGDFSWDEGPEAAEDPVYAGDDEGYRGDEDEPAIAEDEAAAAIRAPPFPPSRHHLLGTDNRGRDLLVRLAYGFNVSLTFALLLVIATYAVGVTVGGVIGYFGGKADLLGQRVIEVWQTIPFLYTVMILSAALSDSLPYRPDLASIFQPRFGLLIVVMAVFGWMGITYYVRGEFLREKARDYVAAAVACGTRDRTIIFKHILPNALTPLVTFAPFVLVSDIGALVALDYLGFGLPAPTPSWGELMHQALPEHIHDWWLVTAPIAALFITLLLVVFVGEAVREAFDPKVHSRLR